MTKFQKIVTFALTHLNTGNKLKLKRLFYNITSNHFLKGICVQS